MFNKKPSKQTKPSVTTPSRQIIDKYSLFEKDLDAEVNDIVAFIFHIVEKGKEKKFRKQYTLDYFNNL